jgi:uncharacterized protein with GYD domain
LIAAVRPTLAALVLHNALLLSLGRLGNIRTQTLRALSENEMGQILGRLA